MLNIERESVPSVAFRCLFTDLIYLDTSFYGSHFRGVNIDFVTGQTGSILSMNCTFWSDNWLTEAGGGREEGGLKKDSKQ